VAGFERFEEIEAWKGARGLTAAVYALTSDGAWSKDYGLKDQIRRASVSVMSNIAEGFARETDKEFHRFLAMARGSASEVKSQLYVALDLHYIEQTSFAGLYEQADKIARQLTGLMKYLKV
jgi:four helix bundle protein